MDIKKAIQELADPLAIVYFGKRYQLIACNLLNVCD